MRNELRYRVEQVLLAVMASLGIVVVVIDLLGLFEQLLLSDAIPKITLLVLSTVTTLLLLEVERFRMIDAINARISQLDIETIAQKLKYKHYAGIVRVYERFMEEVFIQYIKSAKEVFILNTWIPNLHRFEGALVDAMNRGASVRILLLYPNSDVAELRNDALRALRDPALMENVKQGVERCLGILDRILGQTNNHRTPRLEVKVYNSLPSIAVYKADERCFVSVFLHDQLAIDSPQLEIDCLDTILGRQIKEELDILWAIGRDIDVRNWRTEIDLVRSF